MDRLKAMKRFVFAWAKYGLMVCASLNRKTEFHYFPFDIHVPLHKRASSVMEQVCEALDKIGIKYRLTDGTLLGIYREGGFIAHDNDIDFDVMGDDAYDSLHSAMRSMHMSLGRKVVVGGMVQQATYYTYDNIIFDFLFWHLDGQSVVNHSEPGYVREQDYTYFQNLTTLAFNGRSYPVPEALEAFLVMRYGSDWKIPKTYKGDWKEDCYDLKKL